MNLLTTAGGPMSSSRSTKFTSHVETGHLMTDLKSNAKTAALAQRHSSLRLNAATQRMRSAVDKENRLLMKNASLNHHRPQG
ncbi:hypothetical protein ROHU_003268 [Labeo rohita]|uniref:Uncharacterized protein n=1 Tax=Labeo rohita TaxID=84645 RepID=A0A498NXD9_LABRO|nr:hypothetical protein ROHU_003268 [Labeo rohita]